MRPAVPMTGPLPAQGAGPPGIGLFEMGAVGLIAGSGLIGYRAFAAGSTEALQVQLLLITPDGKVETVA